MSMRIDGTYGPQIPQRPAANESAEAGRTGQPDKAQRAGTERTDQTPAVSGDSLAAYVARARLAPAVRADAVAEARRLIESGELDTPEAIGRAAEAIVDRGI